jgi:phage tail sheath protein FI
VSQLKFGSAGVTTNEIDQSGVTNPQPVGIPAASVGTSLRGPAFVPVTVGNWPDFIAKFGETDGEKFGPLAVYEWLRNRSAATYLRVLGVGDGKERDGTTGIVAGAGFTVGENQPSEDSGYNLVSSSWANCPGVAGGAPGRTYFLGCFMSESAGSTFFSDAGTQAGVASLTATGSLPVLRGVIMAPSGVILRLSSSFIGTLGSVANDVPSASYVALNTTTSGSILGSVVLLAGSQAKQEFVMLLNGHKGLNPQWPRLITASLDMNAANYFANVFNTDPFKYQEAGHYLYAHWDIHPSLAYVTGTGCILSGAASIGTLSAGKEASVFLTTGSCAYDSGSTTIPDCEAWKDRFSYARSPWVISQKFGGIPKNLFRFHALDAGAGASEDYKISIENIVLSNDPNYDYASFDIVIRDWNDRDGNIMPLEQWRGLSMDPSSDRYVAKVIGDMNVFFDFDRADSAQKIVVDGSYENQSKYVRVEIASEVSDAQIDSTAVPMGFRGPDHLVLSGSNPLAIMTVLSESTGVGYIKRTSEAPVPYRKTITTGTGQKMQANSQYYWGTQFEHPVSLSNMNGGTLQNKSLNGFALYFPNFSEEWMNLSVGPETIGMPSTTTYGIYDVDYYNFNRFSLENVQVVTSSDTLADSQLWLSATYVRNGNIVASDANKTRAFKRDDLTQANRRFAKFTMLMQGGFDGVNIFDRDETAINNTAVVGDMIASNRGTSTGPNVMAYKKAIDIMKDTVNGDIQLLAIPGIRHSIISDYAISAVEDRFDALYIMDLEQYDNANNRVYTDSTKPSVQNTVNNFIDRALNSSFGAAYFPDVVMQDPTTKTNVYAPPSVAIYGALALNDALAYPWFAPAGFTRGALSTTQEARVMLSKDNMDTLYDAAINPIVAFPGNATGGINPKGGVVVWGQKTLLATASALDRVNVRRLMIEIRRQVREISQSIMFEPNREATLARFSSMISPRLQRIQDLAGLEGYRVVIDYTTTSQQDIDNNTIRGKIIVQPTKSVEFVSLDFVVSNAGTNA